MSFDPAEIVPTSVLGIVSTFHVALLLLRQHRSFPGRALVPLLLPSAVLVAQPWLQPTTPWLAAGIAAHLLWFVACEKLLRSPEPSRSAATRASRPADVRVAPRAVEPRRSGMVALPVLAVVDETPEIRTFRIARPAGLTFQAGQFVTVRGVVDGTPHVRCYSISSAPSVDGYLEISVRRQGVMSAFLHTTVRGGSLLEVGSPAGRFVYPGGDQRPIVLLAGGIGITPLLSMLRHGTATEPQRPITLLYAARTACGMAFVDELMVLQRRHPQVTLRLLTTRESAPPPFVRGRLDVATITSVVADAASAVFLMCGPTQMIDNLTRGLADLGIPREQIRSEAFELAAAARERAVTTPHAPEATAGGLSFQLTLVRSNRVVPLMPRDTLLEAAEAAGADLPSSCRAGMCLTCRCRLLEGDVHCEADLLDEADQENGYILPCVSWPKSDCILEA